MRRRVHRTCCARRHAKPGCFGGSRSKELSAVAGWHCCHQCCEPADLPAALATGKCIRAVLAVPVAPGAVAVLDAPVLDACAAA